MALRFMDSFDHYVTADATEKWTTFALSIQAGQGRRSTASARAAGGLINVKTLDNQPTWIVGFAFRTTTINSSGTYLVQIRDAGSAQCELYLSPTGFLQATRNFVALDITSRSVIVLNVYHYIEMAVTIHNSSGTLLVAVDGATVLNLSGIDTQNTANAYANQICIGTSSTSGNSDFDDLYICDGTGSTNNTLLGDCRVDALLPNGEGSNSAWTVSTGTTHSTLVDETAPNDDTDYLSTSTAAARESHVLTNLSSMTSPVVKGIQHSISAKKDDAGTRQIKSLLVSGATTEAGPTTHTLASSYAYYREIYETDPNTDAAWTTTAIDALEAGMENV